MAKPIEPTPEIKTEEELKNFLEYINRPPTKNEIKMGKEAREIFKNTKFVVHD